MKATDTLTLRLPADMKKNAQKTAENLGINLSTVITLYLKKFIEDKYIIIGKPENEDHIDFYKNNSDYVKVDASAEEVLKYLTKA